MNCEFYLNLIEDFLEDEINEQTAARVGSHIFACPECAAQLEVLKHEKEIYAHYLFAAEPPPDLWTKFQAKLETEENSRRVVVPATTPFWKTYSFGLRHLSAPSVFAAALIVFGIGFGLLHFWTSKNAEENRYSSRIEIDKNEPFVPETGKVDAEVTPDQPPEQIGGKEINAPKIIKNNDSKKLSVAKNTTAADFKLIDAGSETLKKKAAFRGEKNFPADKLRLNEQARAQALELKNLEIETARQLEKVELLLRTFRNARAGEVNGNALYDVAYEKQQARKLLEKNSRLRQSSEMFGMADALELLNRVEPYLLEIANLEESSAPGVVTDIRERVKNQNIIASLQIY
ncbi:MAG: anti-sigma factor [Pyrinomonadaceae bacterium]